MAERAALFFFFSCRAIIDSLLCSSRYRLFPARVPGIGGPNLAIYFSSRARARNTTTPCEGARSSGRTIRAVVAVRPTRNNHGRSGPLPTSRTTTTVGNGSHPIHTAGTAQPQRPTATDRVGEPPGTPPIIVSSWKARPWSCSHFFFFIHTDRSCSVPSRGTAGNDGGLSSRSLLLRTCGRGARSHERPGGETRVESVRMSVPIFPGPTPNQK